MKQFGVIVRERHGMYTNDAQLTNIVIESSSKKDAREIAITYLIGQKFGDIDIDEKYNFRKDIIIDEDRAKRFVYDIEIFN